MVKRSVLILLLLTSVAPLAAWDVVPSPCDASTAAKRSAFAGKIGSAKPGDPLYVRIPFPKNNSEVWDDLVDQFVRAYAGKASDQFTPIANAMARGVMARGRYSRKFLRVEDWSPARCADAGNRGDFYHLVIIHDEATGSDVVRASINQNGLVETLVLPGTTGHAIQLPEAAIRKVANVTRFGGTYETQYVTTWGIATEGIPVKGSVECNPLLPCVALRNHNELYLVRGDEVFRLDNGLRFSSQNELRTPQQRAKFNAALGPDDRYTSLGGDFYIVARVLGRTPYVAAKQSN